MSCVKRETGAIDLFMLYKVVMIYGVHSPKITLILRLFTLEEVAGFLTSKFRVNN
jgi:hypothetical protein